MPYVVRSSEKVRGVGAEYETMALLYLMTGRDDSKEIYCFAIDFYNDVTGLSTFADKAWDIQSKGNKTGGAKAIGRELITLFKNFMSDLRFDYSILFAASVSPTFRIDDTLTSFGIDNVSDKARNSVICGIKDEGRKKEYIEDEWLTDNNINNFLSKVTFVINDKTKADYIRNISKVNPKYIPKDDVLIGIFNKIRDAQAAKKNNESVEGEMVDKLGDVYAYDRVINVKDIQLMVLNTFINGDVMNNGIPLHFIPVINRLDALRKKDVVEDCQLHISTALFDKDNAEKFWNLLDVISEKLAENPYLGVNEIYALVDSEKKARCPHMDLMSVKYLISVMKEALECL